MMGGCLCVVVSVLQTGPSSLPGILCRLTDPQRVFVYQELLLLISVV